jgi:hypothetical protein
MNGIDKVITVRGDTTNINIQVSANSKENRVTGIDPWRGRLNLDIKGKPIAGRANREIISFFTRLFEINHGDVTILTGVRSAQKTVCINAKPEKVKSVLESILK